MAFDSHKKLKAKIMRLIKQSIFRVTLIVIALAFCQTTAFAVIQTGGILFSTTSSSLPTQLWLTSTGNLFVTFSGATSLSKVSLYSSTGTLINSTVSSYLNTGTPNAEASPRGVAFDESTGKIYIASTRLSKVIVHQDDLTTSPNTFASGLSSPSGLALSADRSKLYVANPGASNIKIYSTSDGSLLDTKTLSGLSKFAYPISIAVDATGNIYVVDNRGTDIAAVTGNAKIRFFSVGSNTATTFSGDYIDYSNGTTADSPSGVTLDDAGNVYVLVAGTRAGGAGSIWKYTASGQLIEMFRGSGTNDRLNRPYIGIAVASDYRIFVADRSASPPSIKYFYQTLDKPVSVNATATGTDVALNWRHIPDTRRASVKIQRSVIGYPETPSDGITATSNVTGTTYTDSGLAPGTYYYSLFSISTTGNASTAATANVTVTPQTPSVISAFNAEVSGLSISLSWVAPTDAYFDSVTIRRSTSLPYPSTPTSGSVVTSNCIGSTYADSVTAGTYYYSIFSKNSYGLYSSPATASVTFSPAPDPVSDLEANVSSTAIVLNWTAPSSPSFDSVTIRRSTITYPSTPTSGAAVTRNLTASTYTDAVPNGTYYYSIFSKNAFNLYSTPATASVSIGLVDTGSVSSGSVTITSPTRLDRDLHVGSSTPSTLNIAVGRLTNQAAIIGNNVGETGTVLINAEIGRWTNSGALTVGKNGTGAVVQNEGTVEIGTSLILGSASGSSGTYRLLGGTLSTPKIEAGSGTANFVCLGGVLQTNLVTFSLVNSGGTLAVGQYGSNLQIQGNYTQSTSSKLQVTITSNATLQSSQLRATSIVETKSSPSPTYLVQATGTVTLAGTLEITLDPSVTLKIGDTIYVLGATSYVGTFDTVTLPTLASGMKWDSSSLYTAGTLRVLGDSDALLDGKIMNYPNPAHSRDDTFLGYRLNRDAAIELRLYSAQGREIFRRTFASGEEGGKAGYNRFTLNARVIGGTLEPGIYMAVLLSDGKSIGKNKVAIIP